MAPALVAAVLGGWRLTGPSLWADELATWGAVRLSWDQLWRLSGSVDAVLTPYYAVMKAYVSVAGTSTTALRFPAVVAIVATAVLVSALGRRLVGAGAGLLAGLIFAVLPVTSRYEQEARPYAFVMFAATLGLLCLIRLLERPTIGRLAGYSGAVALAGLCHPLSALLALGGHGAAVVWRQFRADGKNWRATSYWLAAAAVGAAPALVLLALGSRQQTQISWIKQLTVDTVQVVPDRLFLSGAVGGLVLALAVLGVRRDLDRVCLACAAFVPLIGLLLAGAVAPVWVARYVLVSLPPLAVLAAAAALRVGRAHAVVIFLLTAALGYPEQLQVRTSAGHSEDSAKIAAVIRPLYRPGDVAVFPDSHPSIPWAPRDIYERYLPAPKPPDVLRTTAPRTGGRLLATECADASCLGDPARIWLIRVDNPADPFQSMAPGKQKRLQERYAVAQRWQYSLLTVILLVRKTG